MILFTSLIVALVVSLLMTPLMSRLAGKWGFVVKEQHSGSNGTPVMGGVAIFLGFSVAIVAGMLIYPVLPGESIADTPQSWSSICILMLVSGFFMALAGFLDDKFKLSPRMKLTLHSLVAVIAGTLFVMKGAQVRLFLDGSSLAWLTAPITLIWLLGITNSINLLDHADGVTAGVSAIAALFFAALNFMHGNPAIAFISVALAGASLGFLFFNFPPASIFMGDCGSNFLGFILGIIAVLGVYTPQGSIPYLAILSPLLILAVPILDTVMVLVYRKRRGAPLFQGDKNHLAHRLMRMGYSRRTTVVMLYIFSVILGTLALLLPTLRPYQAILAFLIAVGVISVFTIFIVNGEKGRRQ
ncbi:MAG: undecaprenyl/decaprenyl-phosphate alpha-N-acetylglucosaminyl 1-phosphate transferase [Candidatus Sabulitectum sp.]|nr:undecaprenyl/decaprenyl-phosphate alpha-N-acetylglucosaminyl 1-phosphate transferase [Candidatus Sabulitectum sp.]